MNLGFSIYSRLLGGVGVAALLVACTDERPSGSDAIVQSASPTTVAQANEPLELIAAESDNDDIQPSASGSYLSALVAANNRDMGSAAEFFLMTLDSDPDNPELLRQAHLALVMDGRVGEAVPIARRLEAIEPGDPIANMTLTVDAINDGDLDLASDHLGQLPLQGYNTLVVPLVEAWIEVGRGNTEGALAAIASGLSDDGFESFRAYHIALIEDLAGNAEAADRAYALALQSQEGGSYRVVRAYGNFLRREGRTEEAKAVYDDFLAVNPGTVWLDDVLAEVEAGTTPESEVDSPVKGLSEILFGVASVADAGSGGGTSLVYARLASYVDPDSAIIHLLIGDLLEIDERPVEAVEAYDKIPASSPLSWSARLRTAVNLDRAGETEKALEMLEVMVDEKPERSDTLVTMGDLLRVQERWEEAVAAYDQAVERLGGEAMANWRLLYVRGIALERSGDWPRAEENFLASLEVNPESPYVLNYLGYTWVDQGVHLDEALEMIETAVEQRPQDGYIVDSLGWALYRLDDFDGAVRYLERAVELEPGDPVINDHLGDAYWKVGRYNEAKFQWKRAMSLADEGDAELIAVIQDKLDVGLDAGG